MRCPMRLTEEKPSVLARTIAARQMVRAKPQKSLELALAYQLLSEQTACYVEARLAEHLQSDGRPALRKVPGMLAAGYGGLGGIERTYLRAPSPDLNLEVCAEMSVETGEYLDAPAFLRRSSEAAPEKMEDIIEYISADDREAETTNDL